MLHNFVLSFQTTIMTNTAVPSTKRVIMYNLIYYILLTIIYNNIQRSKLRPFWSPWRVEKKIGDQNCQEGHQFGDLFPGRLICFNLHPDIIKSYDHKTIQCPLLS